jgi:hypothetical protein
MNHFTPRKKKIRGPVIGTLKMVRIDHKTQIMVSVKIPDEEARERYLERINRPVRGPWTKATTSTPNMPVKDEYKENEVAVDELEELMAEAKAELPDE